MLLPTKVHIVKAMVFPGVVYRCESWTIKKAEHQRTDAFELWCWRRLMKVPWTARRTNQSIIKEISPEYSLEGLMLRWKLQYFGHLMQRTDSQEKDPDAGKDWRQEKGTTEDEMAGWHHRLDGHEFEQALAVGDGWGSLAWCSPRDCKEFHMTEGLSHDQSWSWTDQQQMEVSRIPTSQEADRGGTPVEEKGNQCKPDNWAFSRGSPVGVPS